MPQINPGSLYLFALINATKHPQIHGHPTLCLTAAQIAPVLKHMTALVESKTRPIFRPDALWGSVVQASGLL